jgi:hypothetical protein
VRYRQNPAHKSCGCFPIIAAEMCLIFLHSVYLHNIQSSTDGPSARDRLPPAGLKPGINIFTSSATTRWHFSSMNIALKNKKQVIESNITWLDKHLYSYWHRILK